MNWLSRHAEIIGTLAAALTTIAFFPQVRRSWQLRGKRDGELSWGMLILFATGVAMWFVYGNLIGSKAIIFGNSVTGALLVAIFVFKLWPQRG
jgi:MtN3 and saliva related transmembrane protein